MTNAIYARERKHTQIWQTYAGVGILYLASSSDCCYVNRDVMSVREYLVASEYDG